MSIATLCRSISTTLSHNLRLTVSNEDRHAFTAQALEHAGSAVFPLLETLRAAKGDGDSEYLRSREAVIELLSFICIPYVRSCTVYAPAIALLEEQITKCKDPEVKRKLATYANQIKKSWNEAEPGGIHHTPRAIRRTRDRRPGGSSTRVFQMVIGVLLFGGCVTGIMALDLTSAVIPGWNRQPETAASPVTDPSRAEEKASSVPPGSGAAVAEAVPASSRDFCRYTDDAGIIHIVNDPAKVPERYRSEMEVTPAGGSGLTQVICKGNQVLVPVTLRYRGRVAQTVLLLDTGASVTTINESVAARLQVDRDSVRAGNSTVADGRTVPSFSFAADDVSVGSRSLPGTNVSILPGSGGNGSEGLLGMNFLKEFRYHVDYKRGVIVWGS